MSRFIEIVLRSTMLIKFWSGKPHGTRYLEKYGCRRENNIKITLKKKGMRTSTAFTWLRTESGGGT
jgi:hypothetical protein